MCIQCVPLCVCVCVHCVYVCAHTYISVWNMMTQWSSSVCKSALNLFNVKAIHTLHTQVHTHICAHTHTFNFLLDGLPCCIRTPHSTQTSIYCLTSLREREREKEREREREYVWDGVNECVCIAKWSKWVTMRKNMYSTVWCVCV